MIYIGTSGWSYPEWRQRFYVGVPQNHWLKFYAEHLPAVEINGSFYCLQKTETFEKWLAETPASFRFSIKANRYLTHRKRLLEPESSVLIQKDNAQTLAGKLTVVLWQLPASFPKNSDRLKRFIDALQQWPEVNHCLEFRHTSWFNDDTANCLSQAGISVCISDAASWPMWDCVTANPVYIRLHGHLQTYISSYSESELDYWAERIADWSAQGKDVHVYFDNTGECAAPFNALALREMLREP